MSWALVFSYSLNQQEPVNVYKSLWLEMLGVN